MKKAEYRISIPVHDELGQQISDSFPEAAHQWLYSAQPRLFDSSRIEGPHRHITRNSLPEDHWHLVTQTLDSPEADSHIKQLAAYVGDLSGKQSVAAQKVGNNGVENWHVTNPKFQPGMGAHPSLIQPTPVAGGWSPVHPEVNVPDLPYATR